MIDIDFLTEKLKNAMANCHDTDFRFNPRILSFLELDQIRIEQSVTESSIFKIDDHLSPRSDANNRSAERSFGKFECTLHHIERGETLETIAKKYSVMVVNIKLFNNLVGRHIAGMKTIKIPRADLDAKAFKQNKDKLKKEKALERQKQFVIAFKDRTGIQSKDDILDYYQKFNGKYYQASDMFHEEQLKKRHQEMDVRRYSLVNRAQQRNKFRNVITGNVGPERDFLVPAKLITSATKKNFIRQKQTRTVSVR